MWHLMAGVTAFLQASLWTSPPRLSNSVGFPRAFYFVRNCSNPLRQEAVGAGDSPPAAGTEAAARAADVASKSLCLFLFQDKLLREFGLPHV